VTGGKPIVVVLYDIPGRKGEVLFYPSFPNSFETLFVKNLRYQMLCNYYCNAFNADSNTIQSEANFAVSQKLRVCIVAISLSTPLNGYLT
jgi:hypothetical protein